MCDPPVRSILRTSQEIFVDLVLSNDLELNTRERALELEATIEWRDPAATLQIAFFATPDGEQRTVFRLDPSTRKATTITCFPPRLSKWTAFLLR